MDLKDKVVHIPASSAVEAIGALVFEDRLAEGVVVEDFETFAARGRVADCTCDLIQCVCSTARQHQETCRFRKALTCAIGIPCEAHDREVCLECDPCDCGAK